VGQEAFGGGWHVGKIRVGWGVWSWATISDDRMEGGKGLTCALFRGIRKMLCWGFTFTQRAEGLVGRISGWCMSC
jgi:hypothetical protein